MENLTGDPEYDYLEGIIAGVLLFDVTSTEGIDVVDRTDLESILEEQELRVSNLSGDQGQVLAIGQLLGADYLLKGEYVFLGKEVLITIKLLDVATAKTVAFSERGGGENTLHSLAEQLIEELTGRTVVLQSGEYNPSIIAAKDESPGSIALHSHLIDAEIFLDGDFVGYTKGNSREPFIIDTLPPGKHVVRIHLSTFGVVKEPEITFHDWEQEVEVIAGRRHVVRAQAYHFNEILYDLMQLLREDVRFDSLGAEGKLSHEVTFLDREGERVDILLELSARQEDQLVELEATLTYDGTPHTFALSNRDDEERELRREIGKILLDIEIDRNSIDYSIWRTDIRQNMW
jgi:TolB-like protein